jgi:selenocysteine-specific elongation factor
MPLTVGTAGHVDHGKTWLVRALTGKDTDRLPEEQRRGLSIELGYAPLELEGVGRVSLIDVPGHERFVRTMVAGATGIDLFLLVVDALEGPRPQTHEHLEILRLLGVDVGVVAVTKIDAAGGVLDAVVAAARELVPGADVVPVSAKTGAGLDELRAALVRAARAVRGRQTWLPTRLWVDRSFSVAGAGTVVTGTLWSGSIGAGDVLRVDPGARDVRVRSVEVHDAEVERAEAGQRVAVGLPGVERTSIARGQALVEPGFYPVTYRLDVAVDGDVPAAATVHLGTAAVAARVVRSGNYAQLRLSEAVVAARGDRVLLRAQGAIAGGRVLDPAPPRRIDPERLALLEGGDAAAIVRELAREPVTAEGLRARGLLPPAELDAALRQLVHTDNFYVRCEWLDEQRDAATERVRRHAEASPLDPGVPAGELLPGAPWAGAILPLLGLEQRDGRVYLPGAAPTLGERADDAARLEAELAAARFAGIRVTEADADVARYLEREGRLVRLGAAHAVAAEAYAGARDAVVAECERRGSIELARFRDLLGISRRPAQLLLERLDADGVTRRVGDARVLRRAARR